LHHEAQPGSKDEMAHFGLSHFAQSATSQVSTCADNSADNSADSDIRIQQSSGWHQAKKHAK
jgi:hypothetical protein